MYESYWKLTGKPFAHRSEPTRFFRSKSHQAALLRLKYGLDNFAGPGLVVGMSGTGKTSLIQVFAAEHSAMRPFVHVVIPALECDELLRLIATELSVSGVVTGSGTDGAFRDIQDSLRRYTAKGQKPLLCFDDAHLLSEDALQFVVQPLLNLSDSNSDVQCSILLAGQPVLSSRLRKLSELSERIAVTTPLVGFTPTETAEYVVSCVQNAAGRPDLFSPDALQRLFEVTAGNPRRINRLCDMALLVGYAEELRQITETQIDAVSSELLSSAA
jgi:type II secretory pathway predicted ATPase ExeA